MELYVVFEMVGDRDIMVAVFLDEDDAMGFVRQCKMGKSVRLTSETRYVVAIPAIEQTITDWYKFRETANQTIDNPVESH